MWVKAEQWARPKTFLSLFANSIPMANLQSYDHQQLAHVNLIAKYTASGMNSPHRQKEHSHTWRKGVHSVTCASMLIILTWLL